MKRTINGKSLAEITAALAEEFPTKDFSRLDSNGKPYLPTTKFRERLDSVVGILNYDFITSEAELVQTGSQQSFVVKGMLIIYDDEGKKVTVKSCSGAADVIYPKIDTSEGKKPGDRPTKINNVLESACCDAFKRCCKLLGIGYQQLAVEKNITGNNKSVSSSSSFMEVKIQSRFSSMSNGGYSCTVEYDNNKYSLIIWKNIVKKIEGTCSIEKFVNAYVPGTILKLYGYTQMYGSTKQIIMSDIYKSDKK